MRKPFETFSRQMDEWATGFPKLHTDIPPLERRVNFSAMKNLPTD